MTDLDVVLIKLTQEFPKFKIVRKEDSALMKFIDVFLRVITFGKMTEFMHKFITTVSFVVYVPSDWTIFPPAQRAVILRHERVHMRQRVKYGAFLYTLLYLLAPLPVGLAYFRAKFEREAYEETLRAMCELYITGAGIIQSSSYRRSTIDHFMGAEYFWMWPFRKSTERWYDAAVKKAVACSCVPRY